MRASRLRRLFLAAVLLAACPPAHSQSAPGGSLLAHARRVADVHTSGQPDYQAVCLVNGTEGAPGSATRTTGGRRARTLIYPSAQGFRPMAATLVSLVICHLGVRQGGSSAPEGSATFRDKIAHYRNVALLDSLDVITIEHVDAVLTRHGIRHFGESAAGTSALWVAKGEHAEAEAILRRDARRYGYGIVFVRPSRAQPFERLPARPLRWRTVHLNAHFTGAFAAMRTRAPRALQGLRHDQQIGEWVGRRPYVRWVRWAPRRYLALLPGASAKPKMRVGYEVEIQLAEAVRNPRNMLTARYQVWDEGRGVGMVSAVGI